ncbi:MAG: ligase-associated DNA damage response exonuclease [Variibacter sp.]
MRPEDLLCPTPKGLYCPPGDFYIDPLRPVARALITHGHSDHARPGHDAVMATQDTLDIMRLRCGENFAGRTQAAAYGETTSINGVAVTFKPAGHVLGSAQICVERDSLRIVASGDYKDVRDPTCAPFEPIACDAFITEATFGLPVFRHPDAAAEIAKLLQSAALFPDRAHLVGAYSLGKAQRVIALLREAGHDAPIYLHGAMEKITHHYAARGIPLGELRPVRGAKKTELAGTITLCPPSALQELWARRFPDPVTAFASGWMRVRTRARQHGVELPLVISDHADWDGLCASIVATGASEIWVTHGEEDALVHWCETKGLRARPLRLVGYGEEETEETAADPDADDASAGEKRLDDLENTNAIEDESGDTGQSAPSPLVGESWGGG